MFGLRNCYDQSISLFNRLISSPIIRAVSVPDGKCVQIIADGLNTMADIVSLPIYDPEKVKTHS